MPKFSVTQTIDIDQPVDKVFPLLNDFNHWSKWSPWLVMEPEAKVDVAPDAKYYEWTGNRIGAGNMRITAEEANSWVDSDLTFLKPWKSHAKVRFEVSAKGNGTHVAWHMHSSLPFFMFWMKKSMVAFIGMDFERGLQMLKDYAETGSVPSKLEFQGNGGFEGGQYIGIRQTSNKAQLGDKMSADFGRLWEFMGDKKDLIAGYGFSIYHKWDMVKDQIEYTAGVQVKEVPGNLPQGVVSGSLPAGTTHVVKHIGAYRHLGNAWGTQHSMMRNKEFKAAKGQHPFELYGNVPGEVPESELITEVHFAVK